jgi:hypothetical protein
MTDFTGAPFPGAHQQPPVLNLGLEPGVAPASETHLDRHAGLKRIASTIDTTTHVIIYTSTEPSPLADGLTAALLDWLDVTDEPTLPPVVTLHLRNLATNTTFTTEVAESQVRRLSGLLRQDARLRRQHTIPTAPAVAL